MSNISRAFHEYMTRIELTEGERERATRQRRELRERLAPRLGGVVRDVLVGSYARSTAIRPLSDIDVFVELDPQVHGHRRSHPRLLLEDLNCVLRDDFPTRMEARSIHVQLDGLGYNVIPAFALTAQSTNGDLVYEIPDRRAEGWIRTNPERHALVCIEANLRAGGMLDRLIKAAKHWNQRRAEADGEPPLHDFHLEVMAYKAFATPPINGRIGLLGLFTHLAGSVGGPCPDPAGLGPPIDADLPAERRRRARAALTTAAHAASTAISHERLGDEAGAIAAWRTLLGPELRA
jgi:predicted nucleotidyltransferase